MVLEAGYPNTTGFRKVTKVTVLIKKKPGMSDEDFIKHYNHTHAAMAAPVLLRHRVMYYSLVCFIFLPSPAFFRPFILCRRQCKRKDYAERGQTYHLTRDITIMNDMLHGRYINGGLLHPYDAICTFVFRDYKDFARFMYDPDSKALTGDHENFMVDDEMRMMVGDEYVVIDGGEMVDKAKV